MLLGSILSYHLWERNWWSKVINEQLEAQGIYVETESTVALNAFSLMLFEVRMEVLVKDKCIWCEISGWRTEPYFWLYHSVQRAFAVWKLKYEEMRIGAWLMSGNCKQMLVYSKSSRGEVIWVFAHEIENDAGWGWQVKGSDAHSEMGIWLLLVQKHLTSQ